MKSSRRDITIHIVNKFIYEKKENKFLSCFTLIRKTVWDCLKQGLVITVLRGRGNFGRNKISGIF